MANQIGLNVVDLLCMNVPERADEIRTLVTRYAPTFDKAHDRPGFLLKTLPDFGLIAYTDRTLLHVWLLGWVLWQEMYCWATAIADLHSDVTSYGMVPRRPEHIKPFRLADFEAMPGQTSTYAIADRLHAAALTFLRTEPLDWAIWPSGIPRPSEIARRYTEDHVVKDFAQHAVGFFLLHEMRHLMLRQEERRFNDPLDEERDCDRWARDFILAQSDSYARVARKPPVHIKSARAMGLMLAMAAIAHTQATKLREPDRDHPSVAERMLRLANGIHLGPNDPCWTVACSAVLGTVRRQRVLPARVDAGTQRDLLWHLLSSTSDARAPVDLDPWHP